LHGFVPSGMPGGGGILAMNSAHKLYWGSDTNLYRGAAGVVQTDGTFNAVNGYQVNGTQIKTGNLGDWTSAGVANGNVPVWNSTTGKWTPGPQSGGLPNTVGCADGFDHLPCVVARIPVSTRSTDTGITPITMYTTPSGTTHMYELCGLLQNINVGGATSGYFQANNYWTTNGAGASASSVAVNASALNGSGAVCSYMMPDQATNILYRVSYSGGTGTPVYQYSWVLMLLE
jgi:hypothetical protein